MLNVNSESSYEPMADLPSTMLYTQIQPQNFFGSQKKVFKCFYHIWARARQPYWFMD